MPRLILPEQMKTYTQAAAKTRVIWSMIRKSVQRFSEKHALGLDPRDHAQSKELKCDDASA
jgi:hypothetical protein